VAQAAQAVLVRVAHPVALVVPAPPVVLVPRVVLVRERARAVLRAAVPPVPAPVLVLHVEDRRLAQLPALPVVATTGP
jgi:hypothetical protein